MGMILFWLQYIIAGTLLYHILRCIYIKGKVEKSSYRRETYAKTDNDERLKHPLWTIVLFILLLILPIINILCFAVYLGVRTINDSGSEYCRYYCESVFTNKY